MKKIAAMIISALMCMCIFTACGEDTTEMDLEINKHLVGAWSPKGNENNYIDEDGILHLMIFYFTGSKIIYCQGTTEQMQTSEITDYEIVGGKLKITSEGKAQYAKLEFYEGGMNWITDNSVVEYVQIPDYAIKDLPMTLEKDPEFTTTDTESEASTDDSVNTDATDNTDNSDSVTQ